MKRTAVALAAALVAGLGIVSLPQQASTAAADVYTDPGRHTVNGREWNTTCESYSSNVERCRAEIKATTVKYANGKFVETTDFVFNNLTYKPSPRASWKGNPLGNTGAWVGPDGQQWRTECDTATTGRNGCRSYRMTTVYAVKTLTPRTYEKRNEWVFNNMVQFSAPPVVLGPCNGAKLPAGFALTADGRPYVIKAPYKPTDQYNPTSIGNFIKSVINYRALPTTSQEEAADQKCLALLAADHLMKGSETTTYQGRTVRWFPYMFTFSANPTIPNLTAPWHSGLAQGGALATFIQLNSLTGDAKWLTYGEQAFNSFLVPSTVKGGITNRENGFLWFEEYPTTPATSVLNGHLEAIIGLDLWASRTGDQEAKDLVSEALDDLEPRLAEMEVPIDGGLVTSYDLVRGHDSAPLRVLGGNLTSALLNGSTPITLPVVASSTPAGSSLLTNPGFDNVTNGVPAGWSRLGSATYSSASNGKYRTTSGGNAWQGLQQVVPAGTFTPGQALTLTFEANVSTPPKKIGASGRIAAYAQCSSGTTLLYENVVRGAGVSNYTFGFKAPATGCNILFQMMVSPYDRAGTQVVWDNMVLRAADPLGPAWDPDPSGRDSAYDLLVYRTPENKISLRGSGTATLQAYYENRWQSIRTVTLSPAGTDVTVPERFTGRNIHLGYHENHVSELTVLYNRTKDNPATKRPYLLDYAERWAPMAPSTGWQIPERDLTRDIPSDVSVMSVTDGSTDDSLAYELGLVDQFTGLPYDELAKLDELAQPAS